MNGRELLRLTTLYPMFVPGRRSKSHCHNYAPKTDKYVFKPNKIRGNPRHVKLMKLLEMVRAKESDKDDYDFESMRIVKMEASQKKTSNNVAIGTNSQGPGTAYSMTRPKKLSLASNSLLFPI
mmetsp:Transcript_36066/g.41649  ORF Transcript_36066/g.41649 Transcript_36066/m.41649 type:complete len:123 (-) Transcript_36066:884-1252(-)